MRSQGTSSYIHDVDTTPSGPVPTRTRGRRRRTRRAHRSHPRHRTRHGPVRGSHSQRHDLLRHRLEPRPGRSRRASSKNDSHPGVPGVRVPAWARNRGTAARFTRRATVPTGPLWRGWATSPRTARVRSRIACLQAGSRPILRRRERGGEQPRVPEPSSGDPDAATRRGGVLRRRCGARRSEDVRRAPVGGVWDAGVVPAARSGGVPGGRGLPVGRGRTTGRGGVRIVLRNAGAG
jgi:hypothetical protein